MVRNATDGHGAEVVFDTVGGLMFEPALKSLGHRDRLLEIASAGDRRVSFDLRDFYHNESQLFGVDTRARDAIGSSALLEALTPFFEQGTFSAARNRPDFSFDRRNKGLPGGGPWRGSRAARPRALKRNISAAALSCEHIERAKG
jgi:NADPH:quinone reductase